MAIAKDERAIYVVEMCAPSFPRPIKIGATSSTQPKEISARIDGLLTASPYPLRLIGAWNRGDKDPTETMLHNLYGQYRVNGEWFLLSPQAERGLLLRSEPHSMIGRTWFTENYAQFRFHSVTDQVRLDWQVIMSEREAITSAQGLSLSPSAAPIDARIADHKSECQIEEARLYMVEDLVPILQMKKSAIYRAIRENNIPCVKIGSKVRVGGASIRRMLGVA